MADNTLTLIGNVTRDPELRFTPTGAAKAEFGLAVSRSWTDRNTNQRQEQTSFFNVVCWGQLGENAAATLAKGSRAIVTGRLEQRTYDGNDGAKKERIEIVADEVGPSLRWATAVIERNERDTRTSSSRSSSKSAAPAFEDEEPF